MLRLIINKISKEKKKIKANLNGKDTTLHKI